MISWEINFPINLITLSTSVHIYPEFMRWIKIVANSCDFITSYEIWLRVFLNITWPQIYCFKPNEIFLKYNGSYYFLQDLNETTFSCGIIIPYNLCLYSKNLPVSSMIAITSFSRSCQIWETSVPVPNRLFSKLLGK